MSDKTAALAVSDKPTAAAPPAAASTQTGAKTPAEAAVAETAAGPAVTAAAEAGTKTPAEAETAAAPAATAAATTAEAAVAEMAAGPAATAEATTNPHDLIHRTDVEKALKSDKGSDAVIESFTIEDFTSKGDNYACIVSSVRVKYIQNEKILETSYVVKLNPSHQSMGTFVKVLFDKEIWFYSEMVHLLNEELAKIDEPRLRIPKNYHNIGTDNNQVIYLEDLRRSGFKMFDRKKGMDKAHTELVLRELGRFHAASILLMSRDEYKGVDIKEKFPLLMEPFDAFTNDNSTVSVGDIFGSSMENCAKIVERQKDYAYAAEFLRKKKLIVGDIFHEQILFTDDFRVICHGDCWNNNFLFRYSADGAPVECRLLDLQLIRLGSPALDLNYMFYCSMNGDVRKAQLSSFFTTYYASFASVLSGGRLPMNFSLRGLEKEFYNKNMFGLIMAMMLIPMVLMDSENVPDIAQFKSDDMQKNLDDYQEQLMMGMQNNPLLGPRLLSLFDEMKETGLLDS